MFSKSLSMKLTKLPQQHRQPRDMVRIQSIPVILEAFNVHLALYSMVSMGCLTLRSECLPQRRSLRIVASMAFRQIKKPNLKFGQEKSQQKLMDMAGLTGSIA